MADPLGFHIGYRIVSDALSRVSEWDIVTPETTLKDVLPDQAARRRFRTVVGKAVRAYSTAKSITDLPIEPHLTVGQVTDFLAELPGKTLTALPGRPGKKTPR
ncbi:MAG: hypothetical protein HYU37_14905 [Acidobacteria bacterium]|nr:hypothetical protein [Acidobacteriota bacterium]